MITYKAVKKGRRVVGHEWYCGNCGLLVHSEPLVGLDEAVEQQEARVARIKGTTESHSCASQSDRSAS